MIIYLMIGKDEPFIVSYDKYFGKNICLFGGITYYVFTGKNF